MVQLHRESQVLEDGLGGGNTYEGGRATATPVAAAEPQEAPARSVVTAGKAG